MSGPTNDKAPGVGAPGAQESQSKEVSPKSIPAGRGTVNGCLCTFSLHHDDATNVRLLRQQLSRRRRRYSPSEVPPDVLADALSEAIAGGKPERLPTGKPFLRDNVVIPIPTAIRIIRAIVRRFEHPFAWLLDETKTLTLGQLHGVDRPGRVQVVILEPHGRGPRGCPGGVIAGTLFAAIAFELMRLTGLARGPALASEKISATSHQDRQARYQRQKQDQRRAAGWNSGYGEVWDDLRAFARQAVRG